MSITPRLLISAAHKSSGKTVFATGLCAELAHRGHDVRPFKKGPDYIDPQWLAAASGRNCYNLDFNTQTPDAISAMFAEKSADGIAIIEANKGLYDGVSPDGSDSNAALAKHLAAPVILIVDCEGMTRGIAPLLRGYLDFDTEVNIAGVVLNQVGGDRHGDKLKAAVEQHTDLPVLGCIPRDERMALPERHLGLIPGSEHEQADKRIEAMRQAVSEYTDIEAILAIAQTSAKITSPLSCTQADTGPSLSRHSRESGNPVKQIAPKAHRLGIFRDAAFNFYYPDDLEALEHAAFKLIPIDSLHDPALPDIDALFIGGGFPEVHAAALEANVALRAAVKDAIEDGLPTYAECGGLMYLTRSIEWHGKRHEMAGVIQADTVMCEHPCGRGYVQIEETPDMPWPHATDVQPIHAAHEFHYSKLVNLSADVKTAYKVLRGEGIGGGKDGIVYKNLLASFVHLRGVNNGWAERFGTMVQQ